MNILLLGYDYFPQRREIEKNFWLDITSLLARQGQQVTVVSVNNGHREVDYQQSDSGSQVPIYNIQPWFPRPGRVREARCPEGFHSLPLGPLFKTITFWRCLPKVRWLIDANQIDQVHFMDNFGFLMSWVRREQPHLKVSLSMPTWVERMYPLNRVYETVRLRTMKALDTVVVTSEATSRRLLALGFPPAKVRVIPWGVDFTRRGFHIIAGPDKEQAKRSIGLKPGTKLVLWSGFLQRSEERDFYFSLSIAQEVVRLRDDVVFVFAFKRRHFSAKYAKWCRGRVIVKSTTQTEFQGLLRASDVFLSPVLNRRRTVAPPLTWVEAMALGVPVATTPVEGTEEIIQHAETGIVADDAQQLAATISHVLWDGDAQRLLSENAYSLVAEKYDVANAATQYLRLWRSHADVPSQDSLSG